MLNVSHLPENTTNERAQIFSITWRLKRDDIPLLGYSILQILYIMKSMQGKKLSETKFLWQVMSQTKKIQKK